jgi:hypothetical protein
MMVKSQVGKRGTSAKKGATPSTGKGAAKKAPAKKVSPAVAQRLAVEQRLLDVLDSIRSLGPPSYPSTAQRLFQLAEQDAEISGLAKSKSFASNALIWTPHVKAKIAPEEQLTRTLIFRREDRDAVLSSDTLVSWAIGAIRQPENALVFTLDELSKVLKAKDDAAEFSKALQRREKEGRWPHGIGTLIRNAKKKETWVFLIEDIIPSPALRATLEPTTRTSVDHASITGGNGIGGDFPRAFADAFEKLDRAGGGNNQVLLRALREVFPHLSRSAFDAALASLRVARRFTFESHDGRHQRLPPEDLDAGIRDESGLYVYVARRSS